MINITKVNKLINSVATNHFGCECCPIKETALCPLWEVEEGVTISWETCEEVLQRWIQTP